MDTNALVTALRKHEIFTDFQSFTQSTFTHNFASSADPPDTILVQPTQRFPSLSSSQAFVLKISSQIVDQTLPS